MCNSFNKKQQRLKARRRASRDTATIKAQQDRRRSRILVWAQFIRDVLRRGR